MSEVPAGKAGAAAGLTNTIRGVTSIIGVAVLGATYSLVYRASLPPAARDALPPGADQSLSQTLSALNDAHLDTAQAGRIIADAHNAFTGALQASLLVAVAVLTTGLILGIILLPRRTSQTYEVDP